jgi:hypothetical protein
MAEGLFQQVRVLEAIAQLPVQFVFARRMRHVSSFSNAGEFRRSVYRTACAFSSDYATVNLF